MTLLRTEVRHEGSESEMADSWSREPGTIFHSVCVGRKTPP